MKSSCPLDGEAACLLVGGPPCLDTAGGVVYGEAAEFIGFDADQDCSCAGVVG